MSFPNPTMLPFFASGGAVSGSSFGLFYTILMQVGYNYYGKKALERIKNGDSLFDVLKDVQSEIQPFSDEMIQIALDSLPGVIDKTINAIAKTMEILVSKWGETVAHNIFSHLMGFDFAVEHKHGTEKEPVDDIPKSAEELLHLQHGHKYKGGKHPVIDVPKPDLEPEPESEPEPEPELLTTKEKMQIAITSQKKRVEVTRGRVNIFTQYWQSIKNAGMKIQYKTNTLDPEIKLLKAREKVLGILRFNYHELFGVWY